MLLGLIYFVVTLIKVFLIVFVGLLGMASLLSWMERRQSAMIQDRIGPQMANFGRWRFWGLLHIIADALKLVFKEDFKPNNTDLLLHSIAPFLSLISAMVIFGVIPIADDLCLTGLKAYGNSCNGSDGILIPMQIVRVDVGVLIVFGFAGLGIIGTVIAGWASNNKYGILGALRSASQLISYEVTLGLTLVGAIVIYGSIEPYSMVKWQIEHKLWGVIVQPFGFLLFLFTAMAENKRIPFDLPEGESEIIAGYFIEYGSMKFAMFFLAEFIYVVVISAIITTLFFGGWDLPFLYNDGFHFLNYRVLIPHWTVILIESIVFWIKVLFFSWLQLMVRWTLPRFRFDQLMALCWKFILPLSVINIIFTCIGVIILS